MAIAILSFTLWLFAFIGFVCLLACISNLIDSIVIDRAKKKECKKNIKFIRMYCDDCCRHIPWKCEEQAITMVMAGYPMHKIWHYLRDNTMTLEELHRRMDGRKKKDEK